VGRLHLSRAVFRPLCTGLACAGEWSTGRPAARRTDGRASHGSARDAAGPAWPLSDRYFLVACCPAPNARWGIYLADVFDNLVLLREEPGYALLEPVPVVPRRRPPVIPSRVDLSRNDAAVYLHDIYAGPGLEGVPRGTIKRLRLVAYHFGYRHLAGPDKIGRSSP